MIMPKGQQKNVAAAICNVPVNCHQTCNVLPQPPERSGIIMLKLKRKLQFRGHLYFQAVCPRVVDNAVNWLKIKLNFGKSTMHPLYMRFTELCEAGKIVLSTDVESEADSDEESEESERQDIL